MVSVAASVPCRLEREGVLWASNGERPGMLPGPDSEHSSTRPQIALQRNQCKL